MVDTTSPIWSRSASKTKIRTHKKLSKFNKYPSLKITKKKQTNKRVSLRIRKKNNVQRIVVLPALSRPRTRIRASLLPNTEENILENKIPIFFIAKWEIIKWRFFQSISWWADRRSWIRSAKQSPFPLCNQGKKKATSKWNYIFVSVYMICKGSVPEVKRRGEDRRVCLWKIFKINEAEI